MDPEQRLPRPPDVEDETPLALTIPPAARKLLSEQDLQNIAAGISRSQPFAGN
jgi:hypothetical protein